MAITELPQAPFDSTIGEYILTVGNTHVLRGQFDSPAYPETALDAGWTWFLSTWGTPALVMDNVVLGFDYLLHVVTPEDTTYVDPLPH